VVLGTMQLSQLLEEEDAQPNDTFRKQLASPMQSSY